MPGFDADPHLIFFRREAQHKKKWATNRLWGYYFPRYPFRDLSRWLLEFEMPANPDNDNKERLDLTVTNLLDVAAASAAAPSPNLSLLFMSVDLRHGRSDRGDDDIARVERQIVERAQDYLKSRDRHGVWAMTAYGSKYRLWLVLLGEAIPRMVYPYGVMYTRESYVDIKDTWDALNDQFAYMNETPCPDMNTAHELDLRMQEQCKIFKSAGFHIDDMAVCRRISSAR